MPSIAELLQGRGAFLKSCGGDLNEALNRDSLLRLIGNDYVAFEPLRDALMNGSGLAERADGLSESARQMLELLREEGFVRARADGLLCASSPAARRFLSGGWLEELAWLAGMRAGADEGIFSQCVGWEVKGFRGENEIDVILRKNARLAFVSCKALQSNFDSTNRKLRNRLMDALHEADNLGDHFGRAGDRVGVLVTSDLYDELRGDKPRYQALMGKAAVFDVRIIPLEELRWELLVQAMRDLLEGDPETVEASC